MSTKAETELFDLIMPVVRKIVKGEYHLRGVDAKDCEQKILTRIVELGRRENFPPKEYIEYWAFRIADHGTLAFLRDQQRVKRNPATHFSLLENNSLKVDSSEEEILTRISVETALQTLDEREFEAMVMQISGYSQRETEEIWSKQTGGVFVGEANYTRMKAGRKLRTALGQDFRERKAKRPLTAEERSEVITRLKAGESQGSIARDMKIHPSVPYRYAKKMRKEP